MSERPILFSGPMVKAILEGRKTQTRRVITGLRVSGPNPPNNFFDFYEGEKWVGAVGARYPGAPITHSLGSACPYGVPGDRLWVRETFWQRIYWTWVSIEDKDWVNDGEFEYVATHPDKPEEHKVDFDWRKRPSIFMPRNVSRITLEIVKVRVERVQDITGRDAIAEGVANVTLGWTNDIGNGSVELFRDLWDSINAKRGFGWAANPWVWVIEFRRVA